MKRIRFSKLSKTQLIVMSEIARDIAQILFVPTVITPVIYGLGTVNPGVILIGMFISVILWVFSVIIVKL